MVQRYGDNFRTSVFVKDTNSGDSVNYDGICPERYKVSTIKSLMHRAFHVSSTEALFEVEVKRIKQLLTNNNYPMKLIDDEIKKFLLNKYNPSINKSTDTIKFFL